MKLSYTHFAFLLLFTYIQLAESCIDSNNVTCLWYFWFCLFWTGIGIFVLIVCVCNKCHQRLNRVDDIFISGYKTNIFEKKKAPNNENKVTTEATDNAKGNDIITGSPFPSKSALSPSGEQLDQASYSESPDNQDRLLQHELEDNTGTRTGYHTTETNQYDYHGLTSNDFNTISVQPFVTGNGGPPFVTEHGAFNNAVYHGQTNNSHSHSGYMEYSPMVIPGEFKSNSEPVPVCVEPNVKLTEAGLNHYSDMTNTSVGYKEAELALVNEQVSYGIPNSPPPSYPGTPEQWQLDRIVGARNLNSDTSQGSVTCASNTDQFIMQHSGINEVDRLVIIPNNAEMIQPKPEADLVIIEDTDLSQPQPDITDPDHLITMHENTNITQPVPNYTNPDQLITMQEDNTNITQPLPNYTNPDQLITMQEDNTNVMLPPPDHTEPDLIAMQGDNTNITQPLPNYTKPDQLITMQEDGTDVMLPLFDHTKPDHLITIQDKNLTQPKADLTEPASHSSNIVTADHLL